MQRRQPRQKKRPSSGGKDKNVKREKPVQQESSPSKAATAVSAPITDDEKVVERAKLGLQGGETERQTGQPDKEAAAITQDSGRGGEEEGQAEASGDIDELLEHVETFEINFEAVEKERTETEERIASLKQTLSVLQKPVAGVEGGGGDAVAKAAILSALEVTVEDDSGAYMEPVQSSDATVAPDGGEEGVVVHVVGEILGGDGGGGAEPPVDESEPNASTVVQSGTNAASPGQDGSGTTNSPPQVAKADQTGQTSSSTEASPTSSSTSNVPSTAVKTTGRPKMRQLAASFSRSTS